MNNVGTISSLFLEIFRLNSSLIAAGDALVGNLGLTSARWQVLAAIAIATEPQPVARIARSMGLSRQAVQRVVNELTESGLTLYLPNPHHQRAKLVSMTDEGHRIYREAVVRQRPWAAALSEGLSMASIEGTANVLRRLRVRLDEPTFTRRFVPDRPC